jgi:hypothetical protein
LAEPFLAAHRRRLENARRAGCALPTPTRSYHELAYRADTWPQAFRVILKAEVMALGDNPRFVVTSLDLPTPECLYRDLYSARGQDENFIKMLKNDLASERPPAPGHRNPVPDPTATAAPRVTPPINPLPNVQAHPGR